MTLQSQTGTADGQAPEATAPQVGSDKGQAPVSADEQTVSELAEARREAAKYRKLAREAEQKLEADAATRKSAEDEAAKEKGEFKTLFEKAEAEKQRLTAELERLQFDGALERMIAKLRPRPEAVEDILRVFPRDGLRLKDGKIEGLEERAAEFKKAKPYLFESDAPARGLSGFNPATGGSAAAVTEKLRLEAEARGLEPQFWADLQAKRQKAKAVGVSART